jgi:hypothetical protein
MLGWVNHKIINVGLNNCNESGPFEVLNNAPVLSLDSIYQGLLILDVFKGGGTDDI